MRRRAKVGLLPLYLELYDQVDPRLREAFEPFLAEIIEGFSRHEVDVVRSKVCRVKSEFQSAVTEFEREEVDIIAAVHLAYSPSLESADILASSAIPLLFLDTTMDFDFGPDVDPQRLMYNHGIHGVQDLASVLRCKNKDFEIVAGHVLESDVMRRACDIAKAALAARELRTMRVLRIGESFPGMGDFAVPDDLLREKLGVTVHHTETDTLANHVRDVADEEMEREIEADNQRFAVDSTEAVHRRSVRVGLGLRRLLTDGQFGALSVNFKTFDSSEGPVDTVPFLEISKAMARGLGYAGEGDALTASLVGALNSAFGDTTFTEIFCPDWKGGTLFISHMGEINPDVSQEKARLIEKEFPWTNAQNPAVLTCAPTPGPAVLVNLSPGPEETFHLLIAPVEVMADSTQPVFRDHIRGWIRPPCSVAAFLEQYSRLGGTHHSALLLGDRVEALRAFAKFAELESSPIPSK